MAGSVRVRGLPASTWVLRAVMLLGAPGAMAVGALADHRPSWTALGVALVLGALTASSPDAWFATAGSLMAVIWWAQAVDAALPMSVLPAVLLLTASHVATVLADHGPARMALDGAVARLWVARGAALVAGAAVLWVLARLTRDASLPGVWVLAVVLAAVATTVTAVVLAGSRQTDGT